MASIPTSRSRTRLRISWPATTRSSSAPSSGAWTSWPRTPPRSRRVRPTRCSRACRSRAPASRAAASRGQARAASARCFASRDPRGRRPGAALFFWRAIAELTGHELRHRVREHGRNQGARRHGHDVEQNAHDRGARHVLGTQVDMHEPERGTAHQEADHRPRPLRRVPENEATEQELLADSRGERQGPKAVALARCAREEGPRVPHRHQDLRDFLGTGEQGPGLPDDEGQVQDGQGPADRKPDRRASPQPESAARPALDHPESPDEGGKPPQGEDLEWVVAASRPLSSGGESTQKPRKEPPPPERADEDDGGEHEVIEEKEGRFHDVPPGSGNHFTIYDYSIIFEH